jgi:hypothetical protein
MSITPPSMPKKETPEETPQVETVFHFPTIGPEGISVRAKNEEEALKKAEEFRLSLKS